MKFDRTYLLFDFFFKENIFRDIFLQIVIITLSTNIEIKKYILKLRK